MFMIAGYETTSTTLSNCLQVLATHQHEQQKLIDEIDSFLENVPDVIINKLHLNILFLIKNFISLSPKSTQTTLTSFPI